MSALFTPLELRSITFRNRIMVSPMCQYSGRDGMPGTWHAVHLGSRAVGGAGAVIAEATAVAPEGRISPADVGLWSDAHVEAWRPIARFVSEQGAVPGVQLAHAGRKASTAVPWEGQGGVLPEQGGWEPLAPSAVSFAEGSPAPREMSRADIDAVVEAFAAAARRALAAGFRLIELHMAHGYLLHEFLSPLSNLRADEHGGDLEHRLRVPLSVARAVRDAWPPELPLFVRISATDWAPGGWDLAQSLVLASRLKQLGVDLIDCSGGGLVPHAIVPVSPGYQVPFAEAIRREVGVATGAVGLITEPEQAEDVVANGHADAVLLGRAELRDPYWPLHAAQALGAEAPWPVQYLRACTR